MVYRIHTSTIITTIWRNILPTGTMAKTGLDRKQDPNRDAQPGGAPWMLRRALMTHFLPSQCDCLTRMLDGIRRLTRGQPPAPQGAQDSRPSPQGGARVCSVTCRVRRSSYVRPSFEGLARRCVKAMPGVKGPPGLEAPPTTTEKMTKHTLPPDGIGV